MNLWIIVGLTFALAVISILIGIIVYMLFFRNVPVFVFDKHGRPYAEIRAKKKKKTLWYKGKNWEAREGSYGRFGKKTYYFAQMADENSLLAYILVGNKLQADENWLEALCNGYDKGSRKFKFGLEKYKELITLAVTVMFVTVMVLGAVKYTTDMSPVQAEAIKDMSNSLNSCGQYVTEGQKTQAELIKFIESRDSQTVEVPR